MMFSRFWAESTDVNVVCGAPAPYARGKGGDSRSTTPWLGDCMNVRSRTHRDLDRILSIVILAVSSSLQLTVKWW